ncbi:alternative oxidase [Thioalkalivibrio thiocyanoxidans]|uniref:alternative oxidase n=1 Tax=Thioalkalivibrio thiocyanoxidans TaxID=152475 RepID=UPI0003689B91|nr:alternative oxidase [Thioalkalivibrio thiocyanoxidans]
MSIDQETDLTHHHKPRDVSDRVARAFTALMRFFADTFFARRYGHRAVVLETVAGVPGMVGATLRHLRSLRRMEDDHGWISTLMDEAENERMHLLTFIEIASPSWFERVLIILAQGFFYTLYFLIYVVSPRTAHRIIGYFEEEAIVSYTEYLEEVETGAIENIPAPDRAIQYWDLPKDARLMDVIRAVREDEAGHRDVNHGFADLLSKKS